MRRTLDQRCTQLNSGELLGCDVVRQYCLPGLASKDDHGQLARTQLLAILENLKLLKILDIYRVETYSASTELSLQAFLQLQPFWPMAAGFMQALVSDEGRRAQLYAHRFCG